jgi:hypothetical protein
MGHPKTERGFPYISGLLKGSERLERARKVLGDKIVFPTGAYSKFCISPSFFFSILTWTSTDDKYFLQRIRAMLDQ